MSAHSFFDRGSRYAAILIGGIAVAFGAIAAADARPYDNMVGCWVGKAEVFDQQGNPAPTSAKSQGKK
jgi:hypothetical protein